MKRLLLSLLFSSLALASPFVTNPSDDQQSLLLDDQESTEVSYDVRRFSVESEDDAREALRQAKLHNLDIWSVDRTGIDLHFTDSVPDYFAARNHTVLAATYTARKKKGKYPGIGSWDLSTVSNCSFHASYHEYDEIIAFTQQLAEDFPKLVEIVKLGRTHEGRDVVAINVGKIKGKGKWRKKRFVVQGAQHAREWIATSTALYFAHSLLASKSDPNNHRKLLKYMDFTIIPVPNPDGYAYTWETDRLWYKNRQEVGGKKDKCKGLDLNRNWGYEWEAHPEPCSYWYPGHKAFDALESRAIAAYIQRTPNIRGFLDLRSYGQLIMHPFSHSCAVHPHDEENLMEAALGAAQALERTHGTTFHTGSLCDKLYSAPGNVVDWMYGSAGIKVAYSVMLRDTGTHGFLLPPHSIRPVGEETSNMVAYLAHWIKTRHP